MAAEVLFTHDSNRPDWKLQRKLCAYLDTTSEGAEVYFSVMNFDAQHMATSLIAAVKRRVCVRINITANDLYKEDYSKFKLQFDEAAAVSPGSDLKVLPRTGGRGHHKDHTKFFIFSQAGDQQNVCIISSQNLTLSDAKKEQHSVVVSDELLHNALRLFWLAIRERKLPKDKEQVGTDNRFKVLFFPRNADYVVNILENLSKRPDHARRGFVRVAMARWKGRPKVADALIYLRSKGYSVSVLARNDGTEGVPYSIVDHLKKGGVEVKWVDSGRRNIHSKYVLLDGYYGGKGSRKTRQKIVWSGAHNFTEAALKKNYELILKSRDAQVYAAFMTNFGELW